MHTIEIKERVLVPEEGLLLGNGDFSVSIYQKTDRIVWRFGKSDVWDRRFASEHDPKPMHIDELARGIRDEGWQYAGNLGEAVATRGTSDEQRMKALTQYGPPSYRTRTSPCPKPVGELALHLPPDQRGFSIHQRLTIERGVVDITCTWASGLALAIRCFVAPRTNVLTVHWQLTPVSEADATWRGHPVWFSLYRWRDPSPEAFAVKQRDVTGSGLFDKKSGKENPPLAPPMSRQLDGHWIIEQAFEPDLQFPEGFRYALMPLPSDGTVSSLDALGTGEARLRIVQAEPENAGWLATAIGSSSDAGGHETALRAVTSRIAADSAGSVAYWEQETVDAAAEFWSRSSVSLGDPFFEQLWYENLHTRRCTFRDDVPAPGLFLPSTVNDYSMWHGDYHTNYNYQQPFWGAYEANQISLGDAYFPGFAHLLELGRKLARDYYGCRGVFVQLVGYPFPVADDPYGVGPFARMTYMTGWAVHQYWFRYIHTKDNRWLAKVGYPVLRDAALFYLDFLKKGEDGLYHAFPSDQGENQFSPDVANYTDRPQVMRHARYCMQVAIEAAGALDTDGDLQRQWREVLEHVPAVDDLSRLTDDQKRTYSIIPPEFLGWGEPLPKPDEKLPPGLACEPDNDRWSWYFGHFPSSLMKLLRCGLFKPERDYSAVRKIIERWRLPNGLLRGMSRETFGFAGAWSESLGILAPLQEMLLQSWDGTIRLFPAWPRNLDAAFTTLRAEGAFLVSATLHDGRVGQVTLHSERGGACRLASPWATPCAVRNIEEGGTVATTIDPDLGDTVRVCFETQPGVTYAISGDAYGIINDTAPGKEGPHA